MSEAHQKPDYPTISTTGRMWSTAPDQPDTEEVTDGTRMGRRCCWTGEIRWDDGEVVPGQEPAHDLGALEGDMPFGEEESW